MERFAFIIHPMDPRRDLMRLNPLAGALPDAAVELAYTKIPPLVASKIVGIRSKTGVEAEGWFIACPMTPNQLLKGPVEDVYAKLLGCCELAEGLGAKIIGLGAHRFELTATRPAQVLAAMDAALDWHGSHPIEARQKALTAHVKERILSMPDRFRLITPLEWEDSSALASIQFLTKGGSIVPGRQILEFCNRMLLEKTAFLRPVPEFDCLRLSMAYYNIEDEYERFFALAEALA
jgi:hypothetical protein